MRVIRGTSDFRVEESTVVAIGKFDGIHKGHGEIIKTMLEYKSRGLKMAVFTFDIPPASVFYGKNRKVLTTNEEKRKIFQELSVDYLIEFPFGREAAGISAEQFIKRILLDRLHMKAAVVGTDCRFGYQGRGDTALLKAFGERYGFDTVVVDKMLYEGREISSTYVREEIEAGNIVKANHLLLRPYLFYGKVVHGRRLGRTLGMPTVNLLPEPEKLLPPNGVYFSRVNHMGQEYRAITNIGSKPTVSDENSVTGIETYIYNFNEEIYGDYLYVSLYQFVRREMKFPTVESLKEQMQSDIRKGEKWHKEHL